MAIRRQDSQPWSWPLNNAGSDSVSTCNCSLLGEKMVSVDPQSADWWCSRSVELPELQVSALAHMFNILVSLLLVTFQACVNSHLNCHYLCSEDILLTVFWFASLQLEVHSRSHNSYVIWKPYDRNLHWHSISGCVGNSENLWFYFQIHPQLTQTPPFFSVWRMHPRQKASWP